MTTGGPEIEIREARPEEFAALGRLMVGVYAQLEGFPTPEQQPRYYAMLADIGRFAGVEGARLLVAANAEGVLAGGVVYFGDMAHYGSGGIATTVRDAAGFRLLAVHPGFRGRGIGAAIARHCIALAGAQSAAQVILHTTEAMRIAWTMYEKLGFVRSSDLDFHQEELPVFGFRLRLPETKA